MLIYINICKDMDYLPNPILGNILSYIVDLDDVYHLNLTCHRFHLHLKTSLFRLTSKRKTYLSSSVLCKYSHLQHVEVPVKIMLLQDLIFIAKLTTCYLDITNSTKEGVILFAQHHNKEGTFYFSRLGKIGIYLSPNLLFISPEMEEGVKDIIGIFPRRQVIASIICSLPNEVEEFTCLMSNNRLFDWEGPLKCRKFTLTTSRIDDIGFWSLPSLMISPRYQYPIEELDVPLCLDKFMVIRSFFPQLKMFALIITQQHQDVKQYLEDNHTSLPKKVKLYCLLHEIVDHVKEWKIGYLEIIPVYPNSVYLEIMQRIA